MHTGSESLGIEMIVLLMAIAAVVAMGVKQIKLPYTIALVLVGLLLSTIHALPPIMLTEELVLFIFLPALLFDAAWNLDLKHLRQNGWPIGLSATVGLLVSVAVIGSVLATTLGLPWLVALLFGAMISATDPVSVLALFKQLRVDHRLATLLEGESLFNDGTAVVVFKLLVSLALFSSISGGDQLMHFMWGGVIQFAMVAVGGILIGAAVGYFFSLLTRRYDDHLLELSFTTIAAYGSFILADHIVVPGVAQGMHVSGVIATVTAGLMMGSVGRYHGMSARTRLTVHSFWEYAAFFVNSLIFLLIGLEIEIGYLMSQWQAIAIAIGAVLLGRALAVYGVMWVVNHRLSEKLPRVWQHVMVWGGLRGALSMALVLSLPRSFEMRPLLIAMVFGVVLFSLVCQGLSIPKLLASLGLSHQMSEELQRHQQIKVKLLVERSALNRLDAMSRSGHIPASVAQKLRDELQQEIDSLSQALDAIHLSHGDIEFEELKLAQAELIYERKALLAELQAKGLCASNIAESLQMGLDEAMEHLKQGILEDGSGLLIEVESQGTEKVV